MKVGVLVRANRKGLGYQTRDFMENFPADSQIVIQMPSKVTPDDLSLVKRDGFAIELAPGNLSMPVKIMSGFLRTIDVLFSAETLYDWKLPELARRHGVRTVVHGNPEFYAHHRHPGYLQPDRWVWPSKWLVDHPDIPDGPIVPCPAPPIPRVAGDPDDDVFRVVHIAGHAAAADRNGTTHFLSAIPKLRNPVEITIVSQDGWLPEIRAPRHVTVNRVPAGVDNREDLYAGQHLVVLPRRYGGNCLPAAEACAAGCALSMSGTTPNEMWPIVPLPASIAPGHLTPFGRIKTCSVRPAAIADTIDRLNANRTRLARHMEEASQWAVDNSWDALRPRYREVLS
jgi:hypothetical protein